MTIYNFNLEILKKMEKYGSTRFYYPNDILIILNIFNEIKDFYGVDDNELDNIILKYYEIFDILCNINFWYTPSCKYIFAQQEMMYQKEIDKYQKEIVDILENQSYFFKYYLRKRKLERINKNYF